jgi:glucosylceramidase
METDMKAQWISSSAGAQWVTNDVKPFVGPVEFSAETAGVVTPDFKGFGGCFNELGWKALQILDGNERGAVLGELFSDSGCAFNYCRLPIGANDYSESWFSHNEADGDYAMDNFSIARDHKYLIPYIRAARAARGSDFFLFATPWSPPSWMKFPKAYNYGKLVWDGRTRKAYADYFVRFVKAYEAEAIPINAVHVQNEPNSDQKFPSCLWTGAEMRDFIRDDLGPAFDAAGIGTDIWAGTIERGDFNAWAETILSDPSAAAYVKGLGFQWAGKHGVQRTRQAYPHMPLIQTENECGDGTNTWEYAHYVFDLIQHYLSNGAEAYVYWNMALEPKGLSTWGWHQNAMITIDPESGTAIYNPEFFVMKHFAAFVRPGASVFALQGNLAANALAFRNPDGTEIFVVQNPADEARKVSVKGSREAESFLAAPKSINTITLGT